MAPKKKPKKMVPEMVLLLPRRWAVGNNARLRPCSAHLEGTIFSAAKLTSLRSSLERPGFTAAANTASATTEDASSRYGRMNRKSFRVGAKVRTSRLAADCAKHQLGSVVPNQQTAETAAAAASTERARKKGTVRRSASSIVAYGSDHRTFLRWLGAHRFLQKERPFFGKGIFSTTAPPAAAERARAGKKGTFQTPVSSTSAYGFDHRTILRWLQAKLFLVKQLAFLAKSKFSSTTSTTPTPAARTRPEASFQESVSGIVTYEIDHKTILRCFEAEYYFAERAPFSANPIFPSTTADAAALARNRRRSWRDPSSSAVLSRCVCYQRQR